MEVQFSFFLFSFLWKDLIFPAEINNLPLLFQKAVVSVIGSVAELARSNINRELITVLDLTMKKY